MRKWYPVAVVVVALAASAAVYGRLPDQVPMHWDMHGNVDRHGPRLQGALFLPAIMALMALLVPVLPRIDPRGANYEKFRPTYHLVMNAVLTLMLAIHLAVLATSLGFDVPIGRLVPAGVGALLVVIGNALPRARPNWMFGIRTPWTLSSERVWERTHRVGGYCMVAAGVVIMLSALLPPGRTPVMMLFGAIAVASIVPLAYSFVAWRQERGS